MFHHMPRGAWRPGRLLLTFVVTFTSYHVDAYALHFPFALERGHEWEVPDTTALVQKKHPEAAAGKAATKKPGITKSGPSPKKQAKSKPGKPGNVARLIEENVNRCPSPSVMSASWFHKAAKLGNHLAALLAAAPPGFRRQLETELTGELVRSTSSSSSASRGTTLPDADFVGTLARTNVAMVADLLAQAGQNVRRQQAWPSRESHLFQLAPELRQLTTWALTLGENESMTEDDSVNIAPTKAEPSPPRDDLRPATTEEVPHVTVLDGVDAPATPSTGGRASPP